MPNLTEGLARKEVQYAVWRPRGEEGERHGIRGTIRSLEITHGRHGWHVHLHVYQFLRSGTGASPEEGPVALEELEGDLASRWVRSVEAAGGRVGERGVVVSTLVKEDGTEDDGGYIVKGVLERGNEEEGRTQWNLLEDYVFEQDRQAGILFKEYASNITSKHRLSWSRALQELGLTEAEERWPGELVRTVPPEEWADRIRPEGDGRAGLLVRAGRGGS